MRRRVSHEAAAFDIQCLMADALKINVEPTAGYMEHPRRGKFHFEALICQKIKVFLIVRLMCR